MAQFARPITPDLDNTGLWITAPLWSKINEGGGGDGVVVVSDSNPTTSEPFTVDLETITDPESATGHILRIRWAKNSGGGGNKTIRIELREGYVSEGSQGTLIATDDYAINSTTLRTDATTMSAGEANSITDYADLQIRVMGVSSNRALKVDFVELETGDAPPTPVETMSQDPTRNGPYVRESNGALYSILNDVTNSEQITIWKKLEGGSWASLGIVTNPTSDVIGSALHFGGVIDQAGAILHVAWEYNNSFTQLAVAYMQVDLTDDSFLTSEIIDQPGFGMLTDLGGLGIGYRPTADEVIVLWNDPGSGNDLFYSRRTATDTWTGPTSVQSNTFEPAASSITMEGEIAHFFWNDQAGSSARHRVLRANNTLSTVQVIATNTRTRVLTGYSVSGDSRLFMVDGRDDSDPVDVVMYDGDSIAEEPTWDVNTLSTDVEFRSFSGRSHGVITAAGRVFCIWVDSSEQQVHYAEWNAGTDSWGSDTDCAIDSPNNDILSYGAWEDTNGDVHLGGWHGPADGAAVFFDNNIGQGDVERYRQPRVIQGLISADRRAS